MTKLEIAKKVIDSNGGIARTADFIMAGLAKYEICNLNNEGHLARIRHGYYKLANNYDITGGAGSEDIVAGRDCVCRVCPFLLWVQ